jgi:hypothetical protein
MDNATTITTAAPRTRGKSSFTVPSGSFTAASGTWMVPSGMASWHLAVSPRYGNAFGASNATGSAYDVAVRTASAMVVSTDSGPIVARDGRTNAKQAGPPRGVPR